MARHSRQAESRRKLNRRAVPHEIYHGSSAMPIYEYRCQTCGNKFEKIRRMVDADNELECPDCRSKAVKRLQSAFAMAGCGSDSSGRFT